ncbi:MAG TPA: hypothetical protein VIL78_12285 [Hanamia sp.]
MPKLFYFWFIMFISVNAIGQEKQTYKIPNLKGILSNQKIVAILPFKVTIGYKRMPKGFNIEGNKKEEKDEGLGMQGGLYTYLLRKANSYTVSFQDPDRTNILLHQDSIINNIDDILPDSLCKILKVDAVIKCSYAYEKTGSEAGAIVTTYLFGYGKTGSGALTMQIYNGNDGLLLWRFYKEMSEGAFTNANQLMEKMMRKVSRNFPYEK